MAGPNRNAREGAFWDVILLDVLPPAHEGLVRLSDGTRVGEARRYSDGGVLWGGGSLECVARAPADDPVVLVADGARVPVALSSFLLLFRGLAPL